MNSSNSTGFIPNEVNLDEMKDITVKLVFIGDGMSGKTQILITFGEMIISYLQKVFSITSDPNRKLDAENNSEHIETLLDSNSHPITSSFQKWAEKQEFFILYGRTKWDLTAISLDTETIGLEDFQIVFPYFWNDNTYRVKIVGSDVGGQNIFDHFRSVLGKIAGPDDNMIVVFDKSRALSCYNSITQINNVIGEMTSGRRWHQDSKFPRIIYCGNKIDLEEHIQTQEWSASIIQLLNQKITKCSKCGKGKYYLPSLVGEEKEERTIKFEIVEDKISYPDWESLVYTSIVSSDKEYGTPLMSEVNTKALAREISSQLIYNRRISESEKQDIQLEEIWSDFGSLLFQRRPLAMQYSGGIEHVESEGYNDSLVRVREKWSDYDVLLPISQEEIEEALVATASASGFLSEIGDFFYTNALSGNGILKMMDSIIQKTMIKIDDPSFQKKRTETKRRIKKF
ncbi:MAG: hypothetical protein ACXADY_26150 [Candidatus Hodarchaeales archaeon]|jgi:GTPase SAR1 family protein